MRMQTDRGELGWPKIYVAVPMTGVPSSEGRRLRSLGEEIGRVAEDCRYRCRLPWNVVYEEDRAEAPNGQTFEGERAALLGCQLLVVLGTCGSMGIGRLLQIAEDNLIEVLFLQHRDSPISVMARGEPGLGIQTLLAWKTKDEATAKCEQFLSRRRSELTTRARVWPKRRVPPRCSKRIEDHRKRHGTSRQELANRLTLPRRAIEAIETGLWTPTLFALRVIASGLETYAAMLVADTQMDGPALEWLIAINHWCVKMQIPAHHEKFMRQRIRNRGVPTTDPPTDGSIRRLYLEVRGLEDEQGSLFE